MDLFLKSPSLDKGVNVVRIANSKESCAFKWKITSIYFHIFVHKFCRPKLHIRHSKTKYIFSRQCENPLYVTLNHSTSQEMIFCTIAQHPFSCGLAFCTSFHICHPKFTPEVIVGATHSKHICCTFICICNFAHLRK